MFRPLLAAAVLTGLTLVTTASGNAVQPQLDAKVTLHSISLVDQFGQRVKTLQQRSYLIVVRDQSKRQNFHLIGPSVDMKTSVSADTTARWTLQLKPGTYAYRSDTNRKLHGTFTVVNTPPPA